MSTIFAELDKLFEERQKISGKRMAQARKKERFSQEQVAEILNKDRSTISNWERGFATPPIDVCLKIARLYKTPIYHLMAFEVLEKGNALEKYEALNRQLDELELQAIDLNKSLEDRDDLVKIVGSLKKFVSNYVDIAEPHEYAHLCEVVELILQRLKDLKKRGHSSG